MYKGSFGGALHLLAAVAIGSAPTEPSCGFGDGGGEKLSVDPPPDARKSCLLVKNKLERIKHHVRLVFAEEGRRHHHHTFLLQYNLIYFYSVEHATLGKNQGS